MIYAVILPLAVFIGWMVAGDMTRTSFAVLALCIFVLLLPALLKWHYPIMLFSWSSFITIFFLPGKPAFWMLMAGISFGIAILNRILQKRQAFLPAPSITITLIALTLVVVVTGQLRGGFGTSALGSASYGGKAYYSIIAAVIGYFALVSRPIVLENARRYIGLFFLPGLIGVASNLIYFAGPAFYFLFLIVPSGFASGQAATEYSSILRVSGFGAGATAIVFYLMAVHGIRGLLQKWWRVPLVLIAIGFGMMGGFRSLLVMIGLTVLILFIVEGLVRSPLLPASLLIGAISFAFLYPLADKLPAPMQRTLSFLPLKIDPIVRNDAQGSLEWRFSMWRVLRPELPNYFWLGKGYSINPTDLYLAQQAMLRYRVPSYEEALLVGNYHSGPLSIYVPFGSLGSLTFLAFLAVSIRALYLNFRYGREELTIINRFLFSFFCAKTIFFFFFFGAFSTELFLFTGVVGLSVALNKGICQRTVLAQRAVVFHGPLRDASATA